MFTPRFFHSTCSMVGHALFLAATVLSACYYSTAVLKFCALFHHPRHTKLESGVESRMRFVPWFTAMRHSTQWFVSGGICPSSGRDRLGLAIQSSVFLLFKFGYLAILNFTPMGSLLDSRQLPQRFQRTRCPHSPTAIRQSPHYRAGSLPHCSTDSSRIPLW
jgi:hypothetical protein